MSDDTRESEPAPKDGKLILTRNEGRQLIFGNYETWKQVETWIEDTAGRWSIAKTGIFQHKPTGEYYRINWLQGSTGRGYRPPFEHDDPEPVRVEQVEVVTKEWRAVGHMEED